MSLARSSLTARTLLARQTRLFSTSPLRASVLDTAKSTVKEADRKVSDAAVKGIEKGGMCSLPIAHLFTSRAWIFSQHLRLPSSLFTPKPFPPRLSYPFSLRLLPYRGFVAFQREQG